MFDVFELDKFIIPINETNTHWFLAIINIRVRATAATSWHALPINEGGTDAVRKMQADSA